MWSIDTHFSYSLTKVHSNSDFTKYYEMLVPGGQEVLVTGYGERFHPVDVDNFTRFQFCFGVAKEDLGNPSRHASSVTERICH